MYMHYDYLKYVRLNRKGQLKNMCDKTPEVAMLADVRKYHSAIMIVSYVTNV